MESIRIRGVGKKSILLIAPDGLSAKIFFDPLTHSFKQRGWEVHTASSIDDHKYEIERLAGTHHAVRMNRYYNILGDISYLYSVYNIIKDIGPLVVLTFTTKPNTLATRAARLQGVPLVVAAIRGLGRLYGEAKTKNILAVVAKKVMENALRKVDVLWFTNAWDRDELQKSILNDSTRTILTKNSIDTTYFVDDLTANAKNETRERWSISSESKVVIMVARMVWAKGIREYCEAASILRREAVFILVAPGESGSIDSVPDNFLQPYIESGAIIYVPYIKNIKSLYAISDLAVLPSYYREGGHPRALLEPMSMSKAVIAADTPYCREPVDDMVNGLVIPPKDTQGLIMGVRYLLRNDEMRLRMGVESRRIVEEKYSAHKVSLTIVDYIDGLLSSYDTSVH